jgi:hypothetical protein
MFIKKEEKFNIINKGILFLISIFKKDVNFLLREYQNDQNKLKMK